MSKEHATIARKSTLILAIKLLITVSSMVAFLFVAKVMGEVIVGMIGFATGLAGIFLQSDFGLSSAHNKFVSEGKNVGECVGAYLRLKLYLTVLLAALFLAALFVWERLLGHGYEDPLIRPVIYVILLYFILWSFAQIPIQTFGGLRQTAKQQMPEFIGTFARMPMMIYVAVAALGVFALAFSYVLTGALMVAIGLFLFRKFKIKSPPKWLLRSYVSFATPLAVYIFFTNISLHLDKVIIQFFWDFGESGNFFAMQRMILVIITIVSSLGPIFFPSISYYYYKRKFKYVKYLVCRAERYLSMIITPIVVVFIVLAVPIITIFLTEGYLSGRWTLAWLSVYALALSLNAPHMHLLNGAGKPKLTMRVGLSIAFTNIALLLVFVPREMLGVQLFGLGGMGAAMASAFSLLVGFLMARHYTRRVARVRTTSAVFKHWLAGMAMAAFLYAMNEFVWAVERWYEIIIIPGMGLMVYLGVLAALKEFRRKDLFFFLDLLRIGKMFGYIRGEMRE